MDRHRRSLPQTTEEKRPLEIRRYSRPCYGPASWLKASALTLQRLAVTVKLTNTHLAA